MSKAKTNYVCPACDGTGTIDGEVLEYLEVLTEVQNKLKKLRKCVHDGERLKILPSLMSLETKIAKMNRKFSL